MPATEIYLDANATTPVIPEARAAAIAAMAGDFGNPSSIHGSGLKARAMMDNVRARARRVLDAPTGELLFLSGATEGIQTAVFSALTSLRSRQDRGEAMPELLLYGATEHKAVPEAIHHWRRLLNLDFEVLAIPVGRDGRHDLEWLRRQAPRAALVCTMAANNETGIISDLDGIQRALAGSPALWMVDGVQALGKLRLSLGDRPIDYAPFSGHKLYAPKGIGMLYVRAGAPFTALIVGGGQEGAMRSGTENMPGIAAMGAVLRLLEAGEQFQRADKLELYRARLAAAIREAFEGVVFNADPEITLPTTLNFSVPGVSSKVLLELFDAASIRVSTGSACGAHKAAPSYVLSAMGLESWRSASAVRLSFGPLTPPETVDEACLRIRQCGASLRDSCMTPSVQQHLLPMEPITRHVVDGAVCYVVADPASRRCLIIDPLPELTDPLVQWIRCCSYTLVAVLDTHSHGDHASSAAALWDSLPPVLGRQGETEPLGWPSGSDHIQLGAQRLTRLPIPGHTRDSAAYLLAGPYGLRAAFVGDTVMPGALGRSDFEVSEPLQFAGSLRLLERTVGRDAFLLPGHDYEGWHACTLNTEIAHQPLLSALLDHSMEAAAFAQAKAELERDLAPTEYQTMACGARVDRCSKAESVELTAAELASRTWAARKILLVDVREPYEQRLGQMPDIGTHVRRQAVPLSTLLSVLPDWLDLDAGTDLVLLCRSGNRSAQVARALRRLGQPRAWSLAGGLALWPTERPQSVPG
ncbi:aminotransferase class V-fold PLP-dependent enzyme [Roseateles cellulosilyticus]|uniref:cysteine desulfurase n=1 Tax=Pelomonas cellulosilytica TaxID=2906762 RepID=A0ABS8XZ86_9BURK|nr:aminotransferase class V-fold PLP-dependent enzyme [Pelomonas sp. P8]MCE4557934.1 aminotransferase class V-fold PLP-dependent enzyme [Pelomonas sp. P8]